jgi:hypothetical protein
VGGFKGLGGGFPLFPRRSDGMRGSRGGLRPVSRARLALGEAMCVLRRMGPTSLSGHTGRPGRLSTTCAGMIVLLVAGCGVIPGYQERFEAAPTADYPWRPEGGKRRGVFRMPCGDGAGSWEDGPLRRPSSPCAGRPRQKPAPLRPRRNRTTGHRRRNTRVRASVPSQGQSKTRHSPCRTGPCVPKSFLRQLKEVFL